VTISRLGGIVLVVDGRDEAIDRKHADELIRVASAFVGPASAVDVFSGAISRSCHRAVSLRNADRRAATQP